MLIRDNFSFIYLTHFKDLGQKYKKNFRSIFGSNENFKICFWDLLAFTLKPMESP